MKKNKKTLFFTTFTILFVNFQTFVFSEIMHLTGCKNLKDGFIKNEYILDFEKSLMKRNYIYDSKTFKKYRWPSIDVPRKSVEETAASIIKIHEIYLNNVKKNYTCFKKQG